MQIIQTRRRFLAGAAMAGAAGIVGLPKSLHAEPPLETTTVRLPRWVGGSYCWAGAYIAGELMRAEGFTDVRYVEGDKSVDQSEWIARGETDFSVNFPPNQIASIDAGVPIKVLTGLHSGCLELIAKESIRSVTDLRGKRVGVDGFNSSRHVWLTLMSAYVGLDPVNDIQWVLTEDAKPDGTLRPREDRRIPRHAAPAAGAARQEDRPHDPQQCRRPPVVTVFLLHDLRDDGLREQVPGGDQAGLAIHPQGRRPLRVGSAMGGAADGRSRFRPVV